MKKISKKHREELKHTISQIPEIGKSYERLIKRWGPLMRIYQKAWSGAMARHVRQFRNKYKIYECF